MLMIFTADFWKKAFLGIILTAIIAVISIYLGELNAFKSIGFSALTLAIILGMILGNTVYSGFSSKLDNGVVFSKGYLLRAGIILYGFRLTFGQILDVGLSSLIVDALVVATTFFIALFFGIKIFKMHPHTAMLVGSGASICGAAAVMATEPLLKPKSSRVSVAVATVVIFGTISMFLYPFIYEFTHFLGIGEKQFGIYIGSTIHEVAQVVVAGNAISVDAADSAVITKMVRVMMLAPFLLYLSFWFSARKKAKGGDGKKGKITIPWFAIYFIIVTGFNSFDLLPKQIVSWIVDLDTFLLAMAMCALGLTTHIKAIRDAGSRPIILASVLFIWLIFGGAAINYLVSLVII